MPSFSPIATQALRSVTLFASLSDADLAPLAEHVQTRHFSPGDVLIQQGDPADALYLIQSGRADVTVRSPRGKEQVLDTIGPGEPAGELGLMTGGTRTATVRAVEPVDALELRREAFMDVMDRPEFAQRVAVVLANRLATSTRTRSLEEPPLSRFLFADTRTAPFWLVLRLWLGYQWLQGSWPKLTSPAWMDSGVALKGFWQSAVDVSGPFPAITYPWYRAFIEFLLNGGHYVWFAKLIALGEAAVGLGLMLGVLTGAAAAGGLIMNGSYLLAGSASINPVLAALEVPVILAWRVAGWWGLDRFILGRLLQREGWHRRSTEKRTLTSSGDMPVAAVQ